MMLSARRQLPILLIAFAALALSLTGEPIQAQENLARTPPGVGQDVCDRTDEVRDAIVSASGAATCEDITLRRIREITSLNLSNQSISSLSVGDFDGLVRLDTLDLSGNDLTELPQGVFDELLLLKTLHLDGNQLQSLPVRLFDELLLLEELTLHSNPQLSLPDGMFGDFSRFAGLQPDGSRWGSQVLEGFLRKHGVSTAEQFIDSLPTDHKQRFAMVYTSESPAVAHVSGDYPRIASWGGDGRFTFAWNTDPDAPSEFSEVIEFLRQGDDRWSAGIIDFSGDTPSITQPASCQVCHGSLNKPLWGAYLNWDGTEYVDPTDTEGIEATKNAMDSTNPRIEPLDFSESYFRSRRDGHARFLKTGGYENFYTVVEEGGTVWSWRHAEVLFHRLKAREDYWAVAEETICKTKTSVNFGNTAREHAVGLFTPGEQNPAVMSNTGEGIQGGSIGEIHVAPDYFYTESAQLGGALVFLMVVDLWEREPIVRKLYRDVSNADTILSSAPRGADLLLFYEPGEATAEDELIQKLRLHFGAGGPVARAALGSQNTTGFWSSTFFAGHLDVMAPRVCDALTKTKPKNLNVTLNAGDAVLNWDTPEDVSSLTGYRILRGTDGATPTVHVADTGTTDTSWTDPALTPGDYVWIAQALYDGYPGPESNPVSETVPGSGPEDQNAPATGQPTISGTAQVGKTLTASTSDISDADGLGGAVYSYQWIAGSTDTEIPGATNDSYTPADTDAGKTIKVIVTFTDDGGNQETLTSAATAEVAPRPNSPATGAPTIGGTAQVGQTLTAVTSGISDADGMTGAVFSYQWLADDADIAGATSDSYTLAAAHVDQTIKVRVSFTDDRKHQETLTSEETAAVAERPIWSATLTVGRSGTASGYSDFTDPVTGELSTKDFSLDGSDYRVRVLGEDDESRAYLFLNQAIPIDFVLHMGTVPLVSTDAETQDRTFTYKYQWAVDTLSLSVGDTLTVSLSASN